MNDFSSTVLEVRKDLAEIRVATLRLIALAFMLLVYALTGLVILYSAGFSTDILILLVCCLGLATGWYASTRSMRWATALVTAALLLGCLWLTWRLPLLAPYLSVTCIIILGALLPPSAMLGVSALLGASFWVLGEPQVFYEGMLDLRLVATGAIALAAFGSWLASRNLYIGLTWALEGYSEARFQRERARDRQGKLSAALKALNEAADRLQRLNYELSKARDTADQMRSLQEQLMANVSHELRTPLALISGFSEMVYMSPESYGVPLPAAYMPDIREIYRNSQHLLGLIDDVLNLSQSRAGKMRLSRELVDPSTVIEQAAATMRPLIEGRGLRLRLALDPDLPPIYLDQTRISQVLINLMNNARRFTDSGEITVSAGLQKDSIRVSVQDTGVGIPASDQDKLFQAFHQIKTPSRSAEGTGLGLAICREFVELHGGTIWVDSRGVPGEGATFHFTLPCDDRSNRPRPVLRRTQATWQARDRSWRERPEILLFSQDAGAERLLQTRLMHYTLVSVSSSEELTSALMTHIPLALLVDSSSFKQEVDMGEIRALAAGIDAPMVVCSLGRSERMARHLGVQGYLTKPVSRADMLKRLETLGQGLRSILVVDDDPRYVRLVSRILRSADQPYDVLRSYSSVEALNTLRTESVDAILLDIMMPDMDGLSLLKTLEADASLAQIPVIIITSMAYDLDAFLLERGGISIEHERDLTDEETALYLEAILQAATSAVPSRAQQAEPNYE